MLLSGWCRRKSADFIIYQGTNKIPLHLWATIKNLILSVIKWIFIIIETSWRCCQKSHQQASSTHHQERGQGKWCCSACFKFIYPHGELCLYKWHFWHFIAVFYCRRPSLTLTTVQFVLRVINPMMSWGYYHAGKVCLHLSKLKMRHLNLSLDFYCFWLWKKFIHHNCWYLYILYETPYNFN